MIITNFGLKLKRRGVVCFVILGTILSALSHIITAVIGSGVLSLSWSISQLGWIGGPFTMLAFASLTLTSAFLLCHCYQKPLHSSNNTTNNSSYLEAVGSILGQNLLSPLSSSLLPLILIIEGLFGREEECIGVWNYCTD